MKKIYILIFILFFISSCGEKTNQENLGILNFEIPEQYTVIESPADIRVNGEVVRLSGEQLKVGDTLKDIPLDEKADFFDQVSTGSINDSSGYRLIETVPSLDTPVCTMQTKQLEFAASQFTDTTFYVISNDTPFALQRFCSANGIDNIKVFSDSRTREFGKQNSLMLNDYSLLTRAIMIIDSDNTIQYIEYADEVTSELDLMNALAFLKTALEK